MAICFRAIGHGAGSCGCSKEPWLNLSSVVPIEISHRALLMANKRLKLDGFFKALLLCLVNLFLEQKALATGKPSSNFNYFRELKID